ncbi:hypothetical protein GXM_00261 [Nostoc sphaeroides CCNUC1]|uniref:Uncharacterized protein n=1 Tax=Nostoc sphaeroides CCNUC1 TaxID=2653204 RepID=A0A5P8VQR7_9NOSO|nr:hypothetical protein GXM_00261 [Nostoc sphaeroides CCNUC1]
MPLSLKEVRNGSEVKTVLHPSENRYSKEKFVGAQHCSLVST